VIGHSQLETNLEMLVKALGKAFADGALMREEIQAW